MGYRYVFGPVPSRRLGRSLGVNNIPPKHCSYSCIYCQVGLTRRLIVERRRFYDPEAIVEEVERRVAEVGAENIDYVTIVPDGEPTLDAGLGRLARLIRERLPGMRLAIITNGSLLWRSDVREDLLLFDYVSVKIDAVSEDIYRAINRPHPSLRLAKVLEGISVFRDEYRGVFVTETMLVEGVNDDLGEMRRVAGFIAGLGPHRAYIAVPTRPPAEPWVRPPSMRRISEIYSVFRGFLGDAAGLLIEPEGYGFVVRRVEDVVAITRVHPLRIDVARRLLRGIGVDPGVLDGLVEEGVVRVIRYRGVDYLVHRDAFFRHLDYFSNQEI